MISRMHQYSSNPATRCDVHIGVTNEGDHPDDTVESADHVDAEPKQEEENGFGHVGNQIVERMCARRTYCNGVDRHVVQCVETPEPCGPVLETMNPITKAVGEQGQQHDLHQDGQRGHCGYRK